MTVLDTSLLIDALTGPKASSAILRRVIEQGELLLLPSLVRYEWLRGPRLPEQLAALEAIFPANEALPLGAPEATMAAHLYRTVGRARGREMDLVIAAYALVRDADLWTLNRSDFRDIPGLRLARF
jgi:predicted nucleic acid-binding protein